MEDSGSCYQAIKQRLLARFPCNTPRSSSRRTPRRSPLSLPKKPWTCPQDLSPRRRSTSTGEAAISLDVCRSLTFCPDIRLLTVRAVDDVTVESTVLVAAVTILPVRLIRRRQPQSPNLRRQSTCAASCLDQVAAH